MRYNIPELQCAPGRASQVLPHPHSSLAHSVQHLHPQPHGHGLPQPNGQHFPMAPLREGPGARPDMSSPEDSDEEEEEEEAPAPKWQGIESIFEAYQDYIEGEQFD